jgi:anthranilate synthase component 1
MLEKPLTKNFSETQDMPTGSGEKQFPRPIVRELPADLETPVSVYLKLAGQGPSFLLESVTGGEQLARYSFIGVHSSRAYILQGRKLVCRSGDALRELETIENTDPLDGLRAELEKYRSAVVPGLPRFAGGLVGYLSYEMIRFFEPSVALAPHAELPDGIFLLTDTTVAFDHAFGRLLLIASVYPDQDEASARADAEARLDHIQALLSAPLPKMESARARGVSQPLRANVTREQFIQAVQAAKEHIAAGDIFQVVLSQRLSRETSASPFDIYRALRRLNPSPYMFFFDFDGLAGAQDLFIIGASPELHVRLEGRRATVRPIAGTRPRGKTETEDLALERDLLADPKERAEHVMLVDLARNDLGRVCEFGSVHVPEQMVVERYSHVMHIVSQVEGQLRPDLDAFDLVRATFPAGTVSGAPKIRAMQIIRDLEQDSRGPYAGVVGYFATDGSLDTCITIRTLVMRGQSVSVQAGAGIVADSDPETEYQETLNKARALAVAVEMAEK